MPYNPTRFAAHDTRGPQSDIDLAVVPLGRCA